MFAICLQHDCYMFATFLQHLCNTFAKVLLRVCYMFATLLQHFCNMFATFVQHACYMFATFLQHFCNYSVQERCRSVAGTGSGALQRLGAFFLFFVFTDVHTALSHGRQADHIMPRRRSRAARLPARTATTPNNYRGENNMCQFGNRPFATTLFTRSCRSFWKSGTEAHSSAPPRPL